MTERIHRLFREILIDKNKRASFCLMLDVGFSVITIFSSEWERHYQLNVLLGKDQKYILVGDKENTQMVKDRLDYRNLGWNPFAKSRVTEISEANKASFKTGENMINQNKNFHLMICTSTESVPENKTFSWPETENAIPSDFKQKSIVISQKTLDKDEKVYESLSSSRKNLQIKEYGQLNELITLADFKASIMGAFRLMKATFSKPFSSAKG